MEKSEKSLYYLIKDEEGNYSSFVLIKELNPFLNFDLVGLGHANQNVFILQTLLNIKADGIFGKDTLDALIKYQKNNNLKSDGLCGKDTWLSLSKQLNKTTYAFSIKDRVVVPIDLNPSL